MAACSRSIGRSSFFATAWMMRMLAWCGTSQSMADFASPFFSSTSSTEAPSMFTATLKVSRPAMRITARPPAALATSGVYCTVLIFTPPSSAIASW